MADARINETKFIYSTDMWTDWFGDVIGVVVYSNAFAVNGVQVWMIPR